MRILNLIFCSSNFLTLMALPGLLLQTSCKDSERSAAIAEPGAFAQDTAFMKEYTDLVVLKKGDGAVAVAPAWQGRVMTSTFDSVSGPSFGWINRPVIEKGFLTDEEAKGELEEHIYIFGGEESYLWQTIRIIVLGENPKALRVMEIIHGGRANLTVVKQNRAKVPLIWTM